MMKFSVAPLGMLLWCFVPEVIAEACAPEITGFRIWDADTNTPLDEYITASGDQVCLPSVATIEALGTPCTASASMMLFKNGVKVTKKTEGRAPFTLLGDSDKNPANIRVRGQSTPYFELGATYTIKGRTKGTDWVAFDFTFSGPCDEN